MIIQRTPQGTQIDRETDDKMRAFLVNACHPAVQFAMRRALEQRPRPSDAMVRVKKYFGGRGPAVTEINAANVVVRECERYCPGLSEWMRVTGYGNEPLMIAAFARWAENPVDYSALPGGGKVQ